MTQDWLLLDLFGTLDLSSEAFTECLQRCMSTGVMVGVKRAASSHISDTPPPPVKLSTSSRPDLEDVGGVSAASTGLYVVPGAVPNGSTGEGSYPLVFREGLPSTATNSKLKSMVRNCEACSKVIDYHLRDKSAPLGKHVSLLLSLLGDVVTASYAGRDVDRGIALHATCHLAVHKVAPSGIHSLGLTLAKRYYPGANYPDRNIGVCLDKFLLWSLRSRPEERSSVAVTQVDKSLQELSSLLDAANDGDADRQLEVMRGCRCPVVWNLFMWGLLSDSPSARNPSLQQLQERAAKQHLARLVTGAVAEMSVRDLAKDLLMTGLPFKPRHVVQPEVTATQRVQRQLWDNVCEALPPKMSFESAILGKDRRGASEGCLWHMLLSVLRVPFEAFSVRMPKKEMARGAEEGRIYQLTHATLTAEALCRPSDMYRVWRKSHGWM